MHRQGFYITCITLASLMAVPSPADTSSTLPLDLDKLAGMYTYTFKNGFVGGHKNEEYYATDVLELVPYNENVMYMRASLSFFNGHSCNIWGMAERDGQRLKVNYIPEYATDASDNKCTLYIVPTSSSIKLDDPTGNCRIETCGARGGYGTENFSPAKKKKIKYMEKLKNSEEYKASIEKYDQHQNDRRNKVTP